MKKADIITGVVLIIFSIFGLMEIATWKELANIGISIKFYPTLIFAAIGLCGAIILGRAVFALKGNTRTVEFRWSTLLPVAFVSLLYAVAIRYIGFAVPTLLFLAAFMYLFGERRWKHLVLISVLGAVLLYIIFIKMLAIQI